MNYKIESEKLYALGMTCIPLRDKFPLLGQGYRDGMVVELQPPLQPSEWHLKAKGEPNGIGVLCGAFSNGFLALDFDLKNGEGVDFYQTWCVLVAGGRPDLYSKLIHVRTKNGGYHVYFKARSDGANRKTDKLAKGEDKKDWIELRSTGGYVLPPPSNGYEWTVGDWSSLSVLSDEEIDYLCAMGRCLNEYVPPNMPVYEPKNQPQGPDSPFNQYDAKINGGDWLETNGFRLLHGNSTQVHFNRPGAKNRGGVDATWYRENNQVRIWSTSTGLDVSTDRNYKPYQLYTYLQHGGDFHEAAKALARDFNPPKVAPPVLRPVVAPVIPKEPLAMGQEIKQTIAVRRLEGWCRTKVSQGVALTDLLIQDAVDANMELEADFVRAEVKKYYEENEDAFGEDNIKLPYMKAEHFLKKHFVLRRNTVLLSTSILHKKTMEESNLNTNSIWNMMQKAGIKISLQQIKAMVDDPQYYVNYDPFVEYFQRLGDRGNGHIEKLSSYVSTDCDLFWTSMFRKALIRTVAGAIGGFPNREAIVLCSSQQKIGKTSFISHLGPWGVDKYFSSEPIVQHKDQMFRICQNMIYLLDEIGQKATNEKHSDYLKMLLSKQSVNERRLFENETTNLSRKVTFWGTSNLPYLYQGQNTRWISIPVREIRHDYNNQVTGTREVDINDVWAEAYRAYMDGEDFVLTPAEMMEQERLNKDWIIGSEAQGMVSTYVREGTDWMTVEQILNKLAAVNPNIIRRINGRSLTEALMDHKIPSRIDKSNDYKIRLFKCQIEEGPSFSMEVVKLEAPF
jgi:hypothetical protein